MTTPHVYCYGNCVACGATFGFHPDLVPSYRDEQGVRRPICLPCITRVNPERERRGLPPAVVPPGAYEPGPLSLDD